MLPIVHRRRRSARKRVADYERAGIFIALGLASAWFLGRLLCGSPLLGYCQTEALEEKDSNLDLGTAMAVSGAAASAHMGTGTIKRLTFWLALLNIRLGYWLPNPKRLAEIPDRLGAGSFLLWRELSGRIDEKGKFVNLSGCRGVHRLVRRFGARSAGEMRDTAGAVSRERERCH